MAATSLAAQLQKLAIPQASTFKDDRKRASLLFSPKEAAAKDRETFYRIGLNGLAELSSLYEGFRIYEDTLFSVASRDFERSLQSSSVNETLSQNIERFLLHLSPYLLLTPAHQALEWLINRYQIHIYNTEALLRLILPYHSTMIFVRIYQLMYLKNTHWESYSFHKAIMKGNPLSCGALYQACQSHKELMSFIAKSMIKYVDLYGDRADQLNTVYAFFCQTSVAALQAEKKTSQEIVVTSLLPVVVKAIDSPVVDFRASAYVIMGLLFTKVKLKNDTLSDIIDRLLTTPFDLSYDVTLLLTILFEMQKHYTKMSEAILNDLSTDVMQTLCGHLKTLTENGYSIARFVTAMIHGILPKLKENSEEFMRFSKLPEILFDELDLKKQKPANIIRIVIYHYVNKSRKDKDVNANSEVKEKETDGQNSDESDIEIIEDEEEMSEDFKDKIFNWFACILKKLEQQYPTAFDQIVKSQMKKKKTGHMALSKLLGFKPSVSHKINGKYLFEHLNNTNPEMRAQAIKYMGQKFEEIRKEDPDFVRSSFVNRLCDDNPNVVSAALELPTEHLTELLSEDKISKILVKICSHQDKIWEPVVVTALERFGYSDKTPVNQQVILTLLPHLFPDDEESAKLACVILKSKIGEKLKLKGKIPAKYENNPEKIRDGIFKTFFEDHLPDLDDILDDNALKKERTTDVCLFMLLKSCSFSTASIEDISVTLNMLLESVENRSIVMSSTAKTFSSEIMSEFFQEAVNNNMLFEVIQYLFTRVIEDMNVKKIPGPWCNVCKTSEMILVRRLYEICITGCAIPDYNQHYVKLLQRLLNKFFATSQEKFEFISNFASGHIFYAADPKDVIGPELQLRSIKLLTSFLNVMEDTKSLLESDAVILMVLFNLGNPLRVIRDSVLEMVPKLLEQNQDKNNVYFNLLQKLIEHKQELSLDHEQVSYILNTILTDKDPQSKVFRRNCTIKLTSILSSDAPAHIKASLLKALSRFNNTTSFPMVVPALKSLEKVLKTHTLDAKLDSKLFLDIYESNIFKAVYSLINEVTITTFDNSEVWTSIETGMREYRECVIQEDHTFTSPAVLIMKQIEEEVFKKMPKEKRKELVYLISRAGAVSNNPTISSVASKVMKKIHLTFPDFKHILEDMLNAKDPENQAKKNKSTVSMLSYQLAETDEWKLGIAILEYVQNKKKMDLDNAFVSLLFQILNRCLRFEEQSYVEYTKQLILSSLWYYCKKFVNETDKEVLNSVKSVFNVELIVQSIRVTQNPQTHHHALILLSHAAFMLPEQVLHHTMEIFTFVGSSVLRHDDAYSFQIITRIIETLIPILVKLDKSVEEYTEKELKQLQKRVVPVLRIFADVVLHVPEHRRLPLYKKLMETIGANQFLWVLLALLLETHVSQFGKDKKKEKKQSRDLATQEEPINRLDFAQSILLEFPAEIGLENFIKLILHIKSLPLHKDDDAMEADADPSEVFCVNGHTAIQLRHYKYACVTFMNTCLASPSFIHHTKQATDMATMEAHYKTLIINTLTFITAISKVSDEKTAKYWRVMLHHSYDLLDHTNNLLSAPMFLNVVRGLLKHTLQTVRRKSMELLNSKIQHHPEFLANVDTELLFSLLEPLLDIIKTIEAKEENQPETAAQELELNQQTALLSLKLLTRMLASKHPERFASVLDTVTEYTCNPNISGNVMASIVLCLAELCSNLKAYALVSLRKFMPALIKVLKKQRKAETPELVLLSTVTAISKIVESLPMFLSPYLQKILFEYSILYGKWQNSDQEQVSVVVTKLGTIKKKIAAAIPPRVLIPVVSETHQMLLAKESYDAIGPVMSVLADSFANVTPADFTALQQDLTTFFLTALQLRSDVADKDIDSTIIDSAEDEVVNALVSLVLKLSETSFRPFYFKLYDWAIRTNVEGQKERAITFYRLSSAIAEKLKGLFVLFAGHFIKNAADLLDSCNNSKTEELYFDTEEKCLTLIKYILKTLSIVFLYDSQSFLNKDRFETLMQPVVDQLENTMGGIPSLKARAVESIIPCVAQFAVATGDDSLWKLLNYQILLKTRHNDAEIRLTALDCLVAMATQLGSSWLPLLAESVPFLAELLEDGDSRIETATKEAIRKLEQILGEPLEKYF